MDDNEISLAITNTDENTTTTAAAAASICSSTKTTTHIPKDLFSCLICYETFGVDQQQLVALKCGHMFCALCIHQWFTTNKVCPTCRKRCWLKDILYIDVSACIVAYGKKKINNLSAERDRLKNDIQTLKNSIANTRQYVRKTESRLQTKRILLHRLKYIFSLNIWSAQVSSTIVYIGAYTGDGPTDSKGVYALELDETKPTLTLLRLSAVTSNPSYVLVHPSHKYLYAVSEQDNGAVVAFQIDSTVPGRLIPINQQTSAGSGPCYLSTNKAGTHVFVANYNNGTVAVLPIDQTSGGVGQYTGFDQQTGSSIDPDRQTSAHAHCILLDRTEQFALSADLGSDQIYQYKFFSNNGTLLRKTVTKAARLGDGPRHLIFNSNQNFVYLINELKSTITVFTYFPIMQPVQIISTLPQNFTGSNTAAEIIFHPKTENFLYASNRGHNSVAVFTVDSTTGYLTLIQHINVQGLTPRNFNISPSGKFLIVANQDSNNIVLFTVDQTTGKLTATGSSVPISKPTCVKYLEQ
ncbi:unnamed protein product [Rotaria socialis]|uniref:RING-type domain-containing protein n=1 Tax=Rotaria socialis TaxID=392032 RepID=A0A820UVJ3_9BILA|nr:unnamed protein product [Rotaria socialis]